MILTWYPDFCVGGRCAIETDQGQNNLLAFRKMCSHHAGLMASHSPDEVFRAIRNSSSAKEKARWAAKQYLKLDKEHPGVAWRTDPDGGIAIDLTQFNLPANKIAALRALIEQEAGTIEQVVGISQIRLEA